MKGRWLLFWVAVAVASFGLIMQAAHIGSANLWIVVSAVALASGAIVAGTLNAAGRRLGHCRAVCERAAREVLS